MQVQRDVSPPNTIMNWVATGIADLHPRNCSSRLCFEDLKIAGKERAFYNGMSGHCMLVFILRTPVSCGHVLQIELSDASHVKR